MGAIKHYPYFSSVQTYRPLETKKEILLRKHLQSLYVSKLSFRVSYSSTVMGYALAILEHKDELKLTSSSYSGIKQFFEPYSNVKWDTVRKRKSEYLKIFKEYDDHNDLSRIEKIHVKTLSEVKSLLRKVCPDKSIRSQEYINDLFIERGEDHYTM